MKLPMYKLINEYNEISGGHWFDKDTMRFFRSRLPDYSYLKGEKAYFITSEQGPCSNNERKYSIRCFDRTTGSIDTIGPFNEMSRQEACRELAHNILNWKIKDL